MRVFMLGWEFPPFISGGLGTACYGLTKAMNGLGTDIIFVLPRPVKSPFNSSHVRLKGSDSLPPMPEARPIGRAGIVPTMPPIGLAQVEAMRHVNFAQLDMPGASPYARPEDFWAKLGTSSAAVGAGNAGNGASTTFGKGFIDTPLPATADSLSATATATAPAAPAASPLSEPSPPPPPAPGPTDYTGDLFDRVYQYADLAVRLAQEETFDVIHAHDWMTYPAAVAVAAATGKPLVVHVHSTEFDRTGENVDQRIYDIERMGMHVSTKVIAVSHLTKRQCVHHFGVAEDKVEVVYNAVALPDRLVEDVPEVIDKDNKIVLFLGRITFQKGPEYFLRSARKVLEVIPDVTFVMAGSGDLVRKSIELAHDLGIGGHVIFTGFLRGPDIERVFKMADLYVMPSVSEPFGIAPLEAMAADVPVLISKQSGVSEVIEHALKVDFWDVDEMANKIAAVLKHPPLGQTLRTHGTMEVRRLSWSDSAEMVNKVYEQVVAS